MRMIIIGNSGSGKTWLAKKLANHTHSPVIHLDHIFWEPGGFDQKRAPGAMVDMINDAKAGESWIAKWV
jgi:adenylate kinase family enzyme